MTINERLDNFAENWKSLNEPVEIEDDAYLFQFMANKRILILERLILKKYSSLQFQSFFKIENCFEKKLYTLCKRYRQ